MIDWINEGCKNWGWQIRIMYAGKDGWPPRSMIGKMMEEGLLGASSARFMQHLPECMNSEAIRYNNAIKTLSEDDRVRLFIHYCVIGKGKLKAARLGEARWKYYDKLDKTQERLAKALSVQAEGLLVKKTIEVRQNEANSSFKVLPTAA